MTRVSCRFAPVRTNQYDSSGVTVTARSREPARAMITVNAIGRNILPSIPVRARIGTYTRMMMLTARVMGRRTSRPAASTVARRSSRLRTGLSASRRRMLSIMTTDPSTNNPKSMAPRLIRLPESPACIMPVKAISMARGMADATIRPARRSPRKRNSTATTSRPPSSRLLRTVVMTLDTKIVRS